MKSILYVLSILLVSLGSGAAKEAPKNTSGDKEATIYIPTDQPPPASAEKVMPTHPFFAGSTGNEVMEIIQELEEKIEKLEKRVSLLEKGKK